MAEPPDDRLTLEQQIIIAADARYGGIFSKVRFFRAFHPHRVLALLHRVEDADRLLHMHDKAWRENADSYAEIIARVNQLATSWPADSPWRRELYAALGAVGPDEAADPS